MRQSNRKAPLIFYVGVVLFCLVLISTHFTSGLYARYIVTSSVSDSARIATFEINETLSSRSGVIHVDANPSAIKEYKGNVLISNTGETRVTYKLGSQNMTRNLPIAILLGDPSENATSCSGTLAPNESVQINVSIKWTDDTKDPKYAGMVDLVRLTITVEQTG